MLKFNVVGTNSLNATLLHKDFSDTMATPAYLAKSGKLGVKLLALYYNIKQEFFFWYIKNKKILLTQIFY